MRRARLACALIVGVLMLGGCAVGPDPGPNVVTGGGARGGGENPNSSTPAAPPLPALTAPRTDLSWSECAGPTAAGYGVTPPAGVTIECARLEVPINPDQPSNDTLTLALTRARTAATPRDAAPLVLTSGSDLPSSRTLLLLAGGAGRGLLDQHPVVAIDRRGIGGSSPLDCLTQGERTAMATDGLSGRAVDQNARIDALAHSASTAADGCTETLTPHQLDYGAGFAADDLEALRIKWGVDHLALLGVGEGADVVLAYASEFAGRAGRIVLDTPTAFDSTTRDRAAARATGVQAALATFVQQCGSAGSCPLGTDGAGTIADVLAKGRAGTLDVLSDTQVLAAITTALAVNPSDAASITALASAIAAANGGNTAALAALADRADDLRVSDGQLVAACNDVNGVVGQNEIPGLIDSWSKSNPLTGTDSALSLVRCASWPTGSVINPPSALSVPPLVLDGANDPINGTGGADALNALFIKAGTTATTVSWDGLGYSVTARSACAADVVVDYLGKQPLGEPTDRGCPTS